MSEAQVAIREARQALRRFVRDTERRKWKQRASLLQIIKKTIPEFLDLFKTINHLSLAGSYAKKVFYSARSDLDIVVGGLKKEDYFKAFLFWERRLPVAVDLIREEEIPKNLTFLFKKRVVVFEKD